MSTDTTDARNYATIAAEQAYEVRREHELSAADLELAASILSLSSAVLVLVHECEGLQRLIDSRTAHLV